jgi:Flp pilus assembly pilin Flp
MAPRRLTGDDGSNLVEYALLISLIFLVALSAIQFFAGNATTKFSSAASSIDQAGQ